MRYFLLLGLLLGSLSLSAQPHNAFRWANQVPLNYPSLASDAAGNTVVTGSFSQPISANGQTIAPYGLEDVFIGKYSAGGQLLWFTHIGGTGATARGNDVAIDAVGNSYVVGGFKGALTQNVAGTPLTVSSNPFSGGYFLPFLVKVSPNGQVQWARQGKDSNGDINSMPALHVATDLLGNTTITGFGTSPSLRFGAITLSFVPRSSFVVHFDAAGTPLWGLSIAGNGLGSATRGIGADGLGNVYLTIATYGTTSINGKLVSPGTFGTLLVKLDGRSGASIWNKFATNVNADDLAVDLLGHSSLIGDFSGTAKAGDKTLTSGTAAEICVVRYHSNGSFDWARSLGAVNTFGERIATNTTGSSIVALVNTLGPPTHAQLLDLNSQSGAVIRRQELGPGTTNGSNLTVSPAEQVYVAGSFTGRLDLGRTTLTSANGAYFLARIDRGPGHNAPRFADLISYYPNPITAYLKLKLPIQCLPARASLFHMSGHEVLS